MNKANHLSDGLTPRQEKVQARIAWVRRELAAYDRSLALLHAFAEGKVTLRGKGYTRAAENYCPTPEDNARLPRTVANLQTQRSLLLKELEVLLAYAR